MLALDKDSGKEVWKTPTEGLTNSSPIAITAGGKRDEQDHPYQSAHFDRDDRFLWGSPSDALMSPRRSRPPMPVSHR